MTELEKAKLVMQDILDYVVEICEKNNLTYWLDFGTLIGTIRHKGFIPWDDDIDITMPRDDYDKLAKILQENQNKDYIYINNKITEQYSYNFSKIVSNNHFYKDDYIKYHRGIFIDIFPIDFYNKKSAEIWEKYITVRQKLKEEKNKINFIKKIHLKIKLYFLKKYVDKNQNKGEKEFFIHDWRAAHLKVKYMYKDIFPLKKSEFEGREYNIPNNFDLYLRMQYGDYMQIPPEEERIYHNKMGFIFDDEKILELTKK